MKKKLLLMFGTGAITVPPIIALVACGGNSTDNSWGTSKGGAVGTETPTNGSTGVDVPNGPARKHIVLTEAIFNAAKASETLAQKIKGAQDTIDNFNTRPSHTVPNPYPFDIPRREAVQTAMKHARDTVAAIKDKTKVEEILLHELGLVNDAITELSASNFAKVYAGEKLKGEAAAIKKYNHLEGAKLHATQDLQKLASEAAKPMKGTVEIPALRKAVDDALADGLAKVAASPVMGEPLDKIVAAATDKLAGAIRLYNADMLSKNVFAYKITGGVADVVQNDFLVDKFFHSDRILQTIHIPKDKWGLKAGSKSDMSPITPHLKALIDKIIAARNADPIWNWHTIGDPFVDAINNIRYAMYKSSQPGAANMELRHALRDIAWTMIPHYARVNGVDPHPAYGYTNKYWAPYWTKATKDMNDYLSSEDPDAEIHSFHPRRIRDGKVVGGQDGYLKDEKAMRLDSMLMQSAQWRVQGIEYTGSFDGHDWKATNKSISSPETGSPKLWGNLSPNKLVPNGNRNGAHGTIHANGLKDIAGGENYVGFSNVLTTSVQSVQHVDNPYAKNIYDGMYTAISVLYDSNDSTRSMGHRWNFFFPAISGLGYFPSSTGYMSKKWIEKSKESVPRKMGAAVLTLTRDIEKYNGSYKIWTQAYADEVKKKYSWIEQVFGKKMFNMFIFDQNVEFKKFYQWIFPKDKAKLKTPGDKNGGISRVNFEVGGTGYNNTIEYGKISDTMMNYNIAHPGKLDVAKFIELLKANPYSWAFNGGAIDGPQNMRLTALGINDSPFKKHPVTDLTTPVKMFNWNGGGSQSLFDWGSADVKTVQNYFKVDLFS